MRADKSSTIGTERLTNYALQINSREEFIRQLTSNLPARPEYFLQDAEINRSGAAALTDLPPLAALSPVEVYEVLEHGGPVLDVRTMDEFAAGHVPGSINIALSGQFATWSGTILGIRSNPVLVAATDAQVEEARTRLARVGFENLRGYLTGGVAAWKDAGLPVSKTEQMTVEELSGRIKARKVRVLDVRREGEWQAGHIAEADWYALDNFPRRTPELKNDVATAVHCKSGYRSMIACSLLERAGHRNVINVTGGFDAWQAANLPVATEQLVKA